MERVTISSKYQVVIPKSVRDRLNLRPGQEIQMIPYDGRIEFIPVRPARELRGTMPMRTDFEREGDRL